ncbi:MAG TPA: hypothetical protein VEY93_12510, partial [Longimicrobium sp.]|nr:hypothetical protein [Longimicrobium sp.]
SRDSVLQSYFTGILVAKCVRPRDRSNRQRESSGRRIAESLVTCAQLFNGRALKCISRFSTLWNCDA